MIADTTFLIHLLREQSASSAGPAVSFLARQRTRTIRTSIISLAEVAVSFPSADDAWEYFKRWNVYGGERRRSAAVLAHAANRQFTTLNPPKPDAS